MEASDLTKSDNEAEEYDYLSSLFNQLEEIAADNLIYFSLGSKTIHSDFCKTFQSILNVLDPLQISLEMLTSTCASFDSMPGCKGNGYRSIIYVIKQCMDTLIEVGKYIQRNRERFFFRSYHFYMEIDSYSQVLARLFTIVQFALILVDMNETGCLFLHKNEQTNDMIGLMDDFDLISRECFYGRSFGFQFPPALRQSLQVIGIAMAAYGDGFDRHTDHLSRALSSILHSGKYVVDPELRAKKIVTLTQNFSMDFCKAFWSLTENHGIQHVPLLICPAMAVNREMIITAEPFDMPSSNGTVVIDIPHKGKGYKKVQVRLLSYFHREGLSKDGTKNVKPAFGTNLHKNSKNFIFHCHGGGFVAQSSKSHEIYLRSWAKELRAPILSVDYSHSPDAPFPEALDECFYAYAWALKNAEQLGTTAERICFAGDSAGANLVTAVALKVIEAGIRLPDGIVAAYPPFFIQYVPSPSRLLCLMDPLLPIGILKGCLFAYAGSTAYETHKKRKVSRRPVLDETYNPFHLDLGEEHYFQDSGWGWNLLQSRSYSDSNLVLASIRSRSSARRGFSDNASFQGSWLGYRRSSLSMNSSIAESDVESIDSSYSGLEMHAVDTRSELSADCNSIELSCKETYSEEVKIETSNVQNNLKRPADDHIECTTIENRAKRNHQVAEKSSHANKVNHNNNVSVMKESKLLDPNNPGTDLETDGKNMLHPRRSRSHTIYLHRRSLSADDVIHLRRSKTWCAGSRPKRSPKKSELRMGNLKTTSNHINRETSSGSAVNTSDNFLRDSESYKNDLNKKCKKISNEPLKDKTTEDERLNHSNQIVSQSPLTSTLSLPSSGKQNTTSFLEKRDIISAPPEGEATVLSGNGENIFSSHNQNTVSSLHKSDTASPSRKTETIPSLHKAETTLSSHKDEAIMSPHKQNTKSSFSVVFDKVHSTCSIITKKLESAASVPSAEASSSEVKNSASLNTENEQKKAPDIAQLQAIKRDPFMSPLLASDEMLRKLPPVFIAACALDPLLDDSVEFMRKLHKLRKDDELYIIENMPHGFLSFPHVSTETREASELVLACMKRVLKIGMNRVDSSSSTTGMLSSASSSKGDLANPN